ncbi:hypothetical protein PENTCL1PPCAC_14254, partial [Pristionchus entomophagus]
VFLFTLALLSPGCLSRQSGPPPCSMCPRTLQNENLAEGQCEVHRTCVSCTPTQVSYDQIGECLSASVKCPNPSSYPRVRLHKDDDTYVDVQDSSSGLPLSCTSDGWTYTDGSTRASNVSKAICFGTASGFQESPIFLNTTTAHHTPLYDASRFKVAYGEGIVKDVVLERGYSGFQVHVKENASAFFTASHLDARYRLVSYHAHWNANGSRGSEHIVNGRSFPAEFHFVHIREDFISLQDAIGKNGVAVIAVFAELTPADNPELKPLIEAIEKSGKSGNFNLEENPDIYQQDPAIILPKERNYFSYTGSLTTGSLQKCVAWNVLTRQIGISMKQLAVLGKLTTRNVKDSVAIDPETTVYTSEVGRSIYEIESSTPKSILNTNKVEEKEAIRGEGTKSTKEDLTFFHRLLQKYGQKWSLLRSKLFNWMG